MVVKPSNFNTDTLILDHPLKLRNRNNMYEVQTTNGSWDIIKPLLENNNKKEYVYNIYKLPSIEQTVQYLHAAAGHPMEETWLKSKGIGIYK